jgi:hypothetical protein
MFRLMGGTGICTADGDTSTIVIVYLKISVCYATVCAGIRFMRCFAEFERRTTSRPHKVLGEGYISEGTKEGHAVGKRAMRMILTC